MRSKANMVCALLLVLLCVAAHVQSAGSRGGKGREGFGRAGGSRPSTVLWSSAKKKSRHHHDHDYDHDHNHTSSAPAGPHGRGLDWRVSGAAATIAAATLVW
ncbi:unnamed protein product [Alopecurus aequalis]